MTAYQRLKQIRECAEHARIPRRPDTNGTAACRYANALDAIIEHCRDYDRLIGKETGDENHRAEQAAA